MADFDVNISPREAIEIIDNEIVNKTVTGEKINEYVRQFDDKIIAVIVYEKHYLRAENRLTLTAVIDNLHGATHVHLVGGGGGQGLFNFDGGAAHDFEICAYAALFDYVVK
ncbi:MAG: hypothetical protein J6B37_00535 [Clostridia bacterium]|nr:hypothetical protein [Clostridia bacterium]